ncbi:ubiquitin thioesterase otulin isoform X2 [Lepisosteus oculatus]|uniref:ubiquitin thioesterase otulin isoform X2 n=1 Tax=Lepisosteus oculatus TaxID=7918 RepID=UPI003717A41F
MGNCCQAGSCSVDESKGLLQEQTRGSSSKGVLVETPYKDDRNYRDCPVHCEEKEETGSNNSETKCKKADDAVPVAETLDGGAGQDVHCEHHVEELQEDLPEKTEFTHEDEEVVAPVESAAEAQQGHELMAVNHNGTAAEEATEAEELKGTMQDSKEDEMGNIINGAAAPGETGLGTDPTNTDLESCVPSCNSEVKRVKLEEEPVRSEKTFEEEKAGVPISEVTSLEEIGQEVSGDAGEDEKEESSPEVKKSGACSPSQDEDGELDLYRAEEEIEESKFEKTAQSKAELAVPQDKCSVAPEVDILTYSEKEWKGNTAKSALIKKGYEEVSKCFSGLRRVRGDNYCALRATLFQAMSQSTEVPDWLQKEDTTQLPVKLAADHEWIAQWRFPQGCGSETKSATELLTQNLELLKEKWQVVAQAGGVAERWDACSGVFRNEEEEYRLMEALKFLMLSTAVELHGLMEEERDVPVFCWLLFARDTSSSPCTFLTNHLNQVGFTGGLEQVEMFLLGYALKQTIQVYRLYKSETDEFMTYYPDDHKEEWPRVFLVTEDDRHYNVLVSKQGRTMP